MPFVLQSSRFVSYLAKRCSIAMIGIVLAGQLSGCGEGMDSAEELRAAQAAFEQGDISRAAVHLKNILQTETRHEVARLLLGRVHMIAGDTSAAVKEFEAVIELDTAPREQVLEYAEALLANAQTAAALEQAARYPDDARALTLAGLAHVQLGDTTDARAAFERALSVQPSWASAHRGLALLAVREGRHAAAQQAIEQATAADPNDAESWLTSGNIAYAQGDFAHARSAFEKALEVDRYQNSRLDMRAHAALASLALIQGDLDQAEPHLQVLERVEKDHPIHRYLRAQALSQDDRLEAAQALLLENLRVVPNHAESLALAGAVAFELGNVNQARDFLERALVAVPTSVYVKKSLASVYLRTGSPAQAVDLLEEVRQASPKDAEVLQMLGSAYLADGRIDAASDAFNQVLAVVPESSAARAGLAMGHLARNEFERSVAELERAMSTDPGFDRGTYLVAVTHFKEGALDRALAAIGTLLERDADNAVYLNLQGAVQRASGDTAAAKQSFERAMAADPDYSMAAMNRAGLEVLDGDWEQAAAIYQRILARNPNHVGALNGIASRHYLEGRIEKALPLWEKARGLNRSDFGSRLRLAEAYLVLGRFDEGLAAINEALALEPENAEALLAAARLYLIRGDLALADEHAARLRAQAAESYQANYVSALIAVRRGDKQAGQAYIEKALAIAPQAVAARDLLVRLGGGDVAALDTSTAEGSDASATDFAVRHLLRRGEQAQAVERARARAAAHPEDTNAVFLLATTFAATGAFDEAREVLHGVLQAHPGNVAAMLNLARLEVTAERTEDARVWYRKVLEIEPASVAALLSLAQIVPPDQAGDLIRRAHAADPTSDQTLLALARYEIGQGNFASAKQAVDVLYRRAPMEPVILNLATRAYLGGGALAEATAVADHYTRHFPEHGDAWVLKSMVYAAKGERNVARLALEQALGLQADNIGALQLLANLELADGNLARAAELVQRIDAAGHGSALTARMAADIAWKQGDHAAAIAHYKAAREADPSTDNILALARAQWASGARDEGKAELRAALETAADKASITATLADILYAENDFEAAAAAYRDALELAPKHAGILDKLAEVYDALGDTRALETARLAHEFAPGAVEAQSTYGWLMVKSGKAQQGLALLQQAAAQGEAGIGPQAAATIRFQLAEALRQAGNRTAARRELEALVESEVDFPEREAAVRLLAR